MPSWIMVAASAYVTPGHISRDCIADMSSVPSGHIPFIAPLVPSLNFITLKENIFSSALCALSLSTIGKRPQAFAYLEKKSNHDSMSPLNNRLSLGELHWAVRFKNLMEGTFTLLWRRTSMKELLLCTCFDLIPTRLLLELELTLLLRCQAGTS